MSDDPKPLGIQGDTPTIAFHVRCGDHDREAKLSGVPVEAHDTCPWCVAVALAKRIAALEAALQESLDEEVTREREMQMRQEFLGYEALGDE